MGKWILFVACAAALAAVLLRVAGAPHPAGRTPPAAKHALSDDEPRLRAARGPLARPAALHLRVRTTGGAPPPAATVVGLFTPPALRAERAEAVDRTFRGTDFEGDLLRIPDLRYRVWDLRIRAPGHRGLARQFALPAAVGEAPHVLEVALEAWASLEVRVLAADGRPVEGAAVRLDGADPTAQDLPAHPADRRLLEATAAARTDREGRCALPAVVPGVEADLRVGHPDHPRAVQPLRTPAPGAHAERVVTLAKPSGIRGSVDLAAFAVPAEAVILSDFHHVEGAAALQRRAPIAPDGSFHLRNVLPGRHTIQVTARGPDHAATALRVAIVPAGGQVDLGLIAPDDGVPLRVRVHAEEPFAPRARVRCHLTLFPAGEAQPAQDAPLDRFEYEFALPVGREHELRGLPPGVLSCAFLLVDPRGALLPSHRDGKAAVTPDARAHLLEVVLRRRAAPQPPAYLRIGVTPPPRILPRDLLWRVFVLDDEGRLFGATPRGLRLASLGMAMPPRSEALHVVAVAHGRVSDRVTVPAVPRAGAAVDLGGWGGAAARVVARVEDPGGRAVPDILVHARLGVDEPAARAITARTDAEGRAVFDTLPGHALYLRAAGDARPEVAPVVLPASRLAAGSRSPCTILLVRRP